MSALFEKGFFVREPAWHGEGIVLADYPGREEAMALAGHDFDVVERPLEVVGNTSNRPAKGWKALLKSGTGELLHVAKETYEVIQNSEMYDVAELLFDQGFQYDAGVTLDGGAFCALTLLLDEPILIPGDQSQTLPYGVLRWAHDGTAAASVASGAIRVVCMNTYRASEAETKKLGTDFTFRHTKNVKERIEDAKAVVRGTRAAFSAYQDVMNELAAIEVNPAQRDLFVSEIIGDKGGLVSASATVSDRVKNNIETERAKINSLFLGETIPEAHSLTGYGLFLAGTEYFEHLRNYRSKDSYVKRSLLTPDPAKASLTRTIRELVEA